MKVFTLTLAALFAAGASAQAHPHLSQAWTALSTGDGMPGNPMPVGKEAYLYEDCPNGTSEDCIQAHIFNYGADNCIKWEINAGNSPYTGTFYQKCYAVDCCKGEPRGVKPVAVPRNT